MIVLNPLGQFRDERSLPLPMNPSPGAAAEGCALAGDFRYCQDQVRVGVPRCGPSGDFWKVSAYWSGTCVVEFRTAKATCLGFDLPTQLLHLFPDVI
jgi:hypothetical protein